MIAINIDAATGTILPSVHGHSLEHLTDPDAPELFPARSRATASPAGSGPRARRTCPAAAWTTETTHRDGQQGGLPLTVEAGIRIYDLMCAFTGASGAIRQAEFFVYRPADRPDPARRRSSATPAARRSSRPPGSARAARDAELVGDLGRARDRDAGLGQRLPHVPQVPAGRAAPGGRGLPRRGARGPRRRPAAAAAPGGRHPGARGVRAAVRRGGAGGCAPSTARRCGRSSASATRWASACRSRTSPRRARCRAGSGALRGLGVASEDLEFHPHNDTHLVVANCLAAIQAGCAVINGTLLGTGERTGNAPLEAVRAARRSAWA